MKNKNLGSSITPENKSISLVDFKEYNNLNEYYIKVGYNNCNELIIVIYNTELLNNIRYEMKKGLEAIQSGNKSYIRYI